MSFPIEDLTPKRETKCFNLLLCCFPKNVPEAEQDVPMPIPEDVLMPEEKEKSRELDLSELPEIDEVPPEKPVPLSANQENLILAFWRFMLTHVIFNFMGIHMNSRKAIGKGAERSEVDTEELPIISTESDVLAEGAAALD